MQFFDPESIPLAIGAIILSCIAGIAMHTLIRSANPISWQIVNLIFGGVGDKLDRKNRPRGDLVFRGFILTIIAILIAAFIAKALIVLTQIRPYSGATEIIILTACLSCGSLWSLMINTSKKLDSKNKAEHTTLSNSTHLDLSAADKHSITRTLIGYAITLTTTAMIAPTLIYILFGLKAVIITSTLSALSWRFGEQGYSKGFGIPAHVFEKIIYFLPELITNALLIIATLFTPGIKKNLHLSWTPLKTVANTINSHLGGPVKSLNRHAIKADWIGPKKASAKTDPAYIKRVLYMLFITHILFLLSLVLLYITTKDANFTFMLDFIQGIQLLSANLVALVA